MSSHRRFTVLTAAAATAAGALSGLPGSTAGAVPQQPDGTTRVHALFTRAERATEKYNAVRERTGRLRERADRLQERIARGQERVNRGRDLLAGLAGAQYRGGGMDPSLDLLLSGDPDSYLERAATLERIGTLQSTRLHRLVGEQRALRRERAKATETLARLERSRAALAEQKRTVKRRLAAARRLLAAQPDGTAPQAYGSGGMPLLGPDAAPSSARAALAVAAVRRALGRPYVWGHAGPGGFDCSGLTQWAYRAAGVSLPRTSQEQRFAGRQVPLSQVRPGDLVVYRPDASHVAMYVGHGQVVHAPYPGARVRYDPIGMMPVSAVTRP